MAPTWLTSFAASSLSRVEAPSPWLCAFSSAATSLATNWSAEKRLCNSSLHLSSSISSSPLLSCACIRLSANDVISSNKCWTSAHELRRWKMRSTASCSRWKIPIVSKYRENSTLACSTRGSVSHFASSASMSLVGPLGSCAATVVDAAPEVVICCLSAHVHVQWRQHQWLLLLSK